MPSFTASYAQGPNCTNRSRALTMATMDLPVGESQNPPAFCSHTQGGTNLSQGGVNQRQRGRERGATFSSRPPTSEGGGEAGRAQMRQMTERRQPPPLYGSNNNTNSISSVNNTLGPCNNNMYGAGVGSTNTRYTQQHGQRSCRGRGYKDDRRRGHGHGQSWRLDLGNNNNDIDFNPPLPRPQLVPEGDGAYLSQLVKQSKLLPSVLSGALIGIMTSSRQNLSCLASVNATPQVRPNHPSNAMVCPSATLTAVRTPSTLSAQQHADGLKPLSLGPTTEEVLAKAARSSQGEASGQHQYIHSSPSPSNDQLIQAALSRSLLNVAGGGASCDKRDKVLISDSAASPKAEDVSFLFSAPSLEPSEMLERGYAHQLGVGSKELTSNHCRSYSNLTAGGSPPDGSFEDENYGGRNSSTFFTGCSNNEVHMGGGVVGVNKVLSQKTSPNQIRGNHHVEDCSRDSNTPSPPQTNKNNEYRGDRAQHSYVDVVFDSPTRLTLSNMLSTSHDNPATASPSPFNFASTSSPPGGYSNPHTASKIEIVKSEISTGARHERLAACASGNDEKQKTLLSGPDGGPIANTYKDSERVDAEDTKDYLLMSDPNLYDCQEHRRDTRSTGSTCVPSQPHTAREGSTPVNSLTAWATFLNSDPLMNEGVKVLMSDVEQQLTDVLPSLVEKVPELATPIVVVGALRYLAVAQSLNIGRVESNNWFRLFFTSLMISAKMHLDLRKRLNNLFASALEVDIKVMNALEVELLYMLDFNLLLAETEYVDYARWLHGVGCVQSKEAFVEAWLTTLGDHAQRQAEQDKSPQPALAMMMGTPVPMTPISGPMRSTPLTPTANTFPFANSARSMGLGVGGARGLSCAHSLSTSPYLGAYGGGAVTGHAGAASVNPIFGSLPPMELTPTAADASASYAFDRATPVNGTPMHSSTPVHIGLVGGGAVYRGSPQKGSNIMNTPIAAYQMPTETVSHLGHFAITTPRLFSARVPQHATCLSTITLDGDGGNPATTPAVTASGPDLFSVGGTGNRSASSGVFHEFHDPLRAANGTPFEEVGGGAIFEGYSSSSDETDSNKLPPPPDADFSPPPVLALTIASPSEDYSYGVRNNEQNRQQHATKASPPPPRGDRPVRPSFATESLERALAAPFPAETMSPLRPPSPRLRRWDMDVHRGPSIVGGAGTRRLGSEEGGQARSRLRALGESATGDPPRRGFFAPKSFAETSVRPVQVQKDGETRGAFNMGNLCSTTPPPQKEEERCSVGGDRLTKHSLGSSSASSYQILDKAARLGAIHHEGDALGDDSDWEGAVVSPAQRVTCPKNAWRDSRGSASSNGNVLTTTTTDGNGASHDNGSAPWCAKGNKHSATATSSLFSPLSPLSSPSSAASPTNSTNLNKDQSVRGFEHKGASAPKKQEQAEPVPSSSCVSPFPLAVHVVVSPLSDIGWTPPPSTVSVSPPPQGYRYHEEEHDVKKALNHGYNRDADHQPLKVRAGHRTANEGEFCFLPPPPMLRQETLPSEGFSFGPEGVGSPHRDVDAPPPRNEISSERRRRGFFSSSTELKLLSTDSNAMRTEPSTDTTTASQSGNPPRNSCVPNFPNAMIASIVSRASAQ